MRAMRVSLCSGALARLLLAGGFAAGLAAPAHAEHICSGRSDEYTVSEVYNQGGVMVSAWCEWGSAGDDGDGAQMRYYSPEEWQAFAEHGAEVDAASAEARRLAVQRYRQLQQGLWFLPGEQPFAGWATGPKRRSARRASAPAAPVDCTASFWTPEGAVILSANDGPQGKAVIRYLGYSIPPPRKPETRAFSLTQDGATQTVQAVIARVGLGRRVMGMVSFAVPSGNALVDAIAEVQDYALADRGKTIFAGQWRGGLRAREGLARCLAGIGREQMRGAALEHGR